MSVEHKRALLLSVGYGEGHNAAARALLQELTGRGWTASVADPCQLSHPWLFALTQRFYHLCVRRAPWLWGVTYAQTDTADWRARAYSPFIKGVTQLVAELVQQEQPDVVVCTYPLYAHLLDALREDGKVKVPYAVVVTDALEISRPWLVNNSPRIFMTDEYSAQRVLERYAMAPERCVVSGFPVRREFSPHCKREIPTPQNLKLVYGAYAPLAQVRADLSALVKNYPAARITVLAGERRRELADFQSDCVDVLEYTSEMSALFAEAHFYIGKAGAATVFEAYASHLPVIVNYALPGQEQGNLELLLLDGAGVSVASTAELLTRLDALLEDGAAGWLRLHKAMCNLKRSGGAVCVADHLETMISV